MNSQNASKIFDFLKKKRTFFILGLFSIIYIWKIFLIDYVVWDTSVYVGMAKFIFSMGQSGFYEIIRPPLLPVLIGFLWKIGFSPIIAAKLIAVLFSLLAIFLTYKMGKELGGENTGLFAAVILCITPVFFVYSTLSLSGIPAAVLIISAILFAIRGKMILSGVFTGLAFLMRFPAGGILPTIMIVVFFHTLFSKVEGSKFLGRLISAFSISFMVLLGFLIIAIPFLAANSFLLASDDITPAQAAVMPFTKAIWHQGNPAYLIRGTDTESKINDLLYYPENLMFDSDFSNPFLLFSLIGFVFYLFNKAFLRMEMNYVLTSLVLFLSYFTYITNKQIRFSFVFLPLICVFAGYGIGEIINRMKHNSDKRTVFAMICITIVIFTFYAFPRLDKLDYYFEHTILFDRLGSTLLEYDEIMTSDPIISVVSNAKVQFHGFSPSETLEKYELEFDGDILVYNEAPFWCSEDDIECINEKRTVLAYLIGRYNLLFFSEYYGREYYVFSKDMADKGIDKSDLDVLDSVRLSQNKEGVRSFIVFRMDQAFSIYRDDGLNNIWEEGALYDVMDLFAEEKVPYSASVIPLDMVNMDEASRNILLKKVSVSQIIEIAQNGYSHEDIGGRSEFSGLSYEVQMEKIMKGSDILEKYFGKKPRVFIPPYNNADGVSLEVLDDFGFLVFSSTLGNSIALKGGVSRYDQTIPFMSWEDGKSRPKTFDELKTELLHFYAYKNFIVISFSTTNLGSEGLSSLEKIVEYAKYLDVMFVSFEDMDSWYRFRNQVGFALYDNEIEIEVSDSYEDLHPDGLTIEFESSGKYSLVSNYEGKLFIKNKNSKTINVCLDNSCYNIAAGVSVKV